MGSEDLEGFLCPPSSHGGLSNDSAQSQSCGLFPPHSCPCLPSLYLPAFLIPSGQLADKGGAAPWDGGGGRAGGRWQQALGWDDTALRGLEGMYFITVLHTRNWVTWRDLEKERVEGCLGGKS